MINPSENLHPLPPQEDDDNEANMDDQLEALKRNEEQSSKIDDWYSQDSDEDLKKFEEARENAAFNKPTTSVDHSAKTRQVTVKKSEEVTKQTAPTPKSNYDEDELDELSDEISAEIELKRRYSAPHTEKTKEINVNAEKEEDENLTTLEKSREENAELFDDTNPNSP